MKTFRTMGLVCLLALPALGDDWSSLGRDGGRTRLPSETLASPAVLGTTATGSVGVASPVAADGVLVIAGLDGKIRAYRESDRTLLWTAATGGQVIATPALDRGRVYVPCTNGTLYCFRLADGAPLGTVSTGGADQSSPVVSGSTLFMSSGFPNTSALAIDAAGGSTTWQSALEQVSNSSPALAPGMVLTACNSGTVYALDAATGDEVWSYPAGGTFGHSSPMVDGESVYLVSDATFRRVDLNPANWAANWSVSLADPAPPASPMGLDWAASSPVKAGNLIVVLVRFNYHLDQDGDGFADARTLREFAVAIDPATQDAAWSAFLGEFSAADANYIPPYQLCPSPVATGSGVAVASSVAASLRILSLADGSATTTFALDAPCLSSPLVANARLYALTRPGTLHVYEDPGHVQPAAAAGLAPSAVELDATPADLQWTSVPGATYLVRIARDGEILADWDVEAVVPGGSMTCPPLDEAGVTYTWGVRVRDAAGAFGPWAVASFSINLPPDAPGGLTAVAKHGKVILNWTPSPSPNAVAVTLAYGPTGGASGAPIDLGNATTTTVAGLTNGTEYTFVLRALDSDGDHSAPASIAATPLQLITVGGIGFDTLEAAAGAAARNQTIQVGEDTFRIQQTLFLRSGVSLAGVNAHVTRIEAAGPFAMIAAAGHQSIALVTLADGSIGVQVDGTQTVVRNCVIRGMSDAGISVRGRAEIVNNTIVRNAVVGVRSLGSAEARNNIVQDNGAGFTGTVDSTYNDVSDGYGGVRPGTGDLQSPVLFIDEAAGDYREAPLQPSLDAGDRRDDYSYEPSPNGGRINLGAFGNTALAALSPSAEPSSGSGGSCGASVSVLPADGGGFAVAALIILLLGMLDLGRWNSRADRR